MMSIIFKLLPIILVSFIFYLLIYDIYPKYQELLNLTKQLNELKNKEKEIDNLQKLIKILSQNSNIRQLLDNKEVLDLWLPQEPKIENILASLFSIYQVNNLVFRGTRLDVLEEPRVYNSNILPVKVINFKLEIKGDSALMNFIVAIEQNVRLMQIKKAKLSSEESNFEVESYYLSQ